MPGFASVCTRVVLAAVLAGSPKLATAAPSDVAEFEAQYEAGQAQYDAGEFLAAARTWKAAAGRLPNTPEQRTNRAAIFDYLADAYDQALAARDDPAVVREALALLDEHAAQASAAVPAEPVSARVEAVREKLRARVASEAAPQVVEAEPAPSTHTSRPRSDEPVQSVKPWRGLAIGGGVAIAGGLAMVPLFAIGIPRANRHEDSFEASPLGCQVDNPVGECADYVKSGRAANGMAVVGLVLAPTLVTAGIAMLVVAMKRKRAVDHAFAPMLGRGLAGVGWSGRF